MVDSNGVQKSDNKIDESPVSPEFNMYIGPDWMFLLLWWSILTLSVSVCVNGLDWIKAVNIQNGLDWIGLDWMWQIRTHHIQVRTFQAD